MNSSAKHLGVFVCTAIVALASFAAAQSRKADIEDRAAVVDDALNQLKYAEADKLLEPLLVQARGARADVFPLIRLGEKYNDVGKPQQAERILRVVIEELEAAGAEGTEYIHEPILHLGEALAAQKRYDEAEPWYKRYVGIYEAAYKKSGGPPNQVDANLRASLGFLAGFYMTAGRHADAETVYRRLLAAEEKAVGENETTLQFPLNDLADAIRLQKRYPEAEALYQRALKVDKDSDRALLGYAELQAALGKNQEAEAMYKKAIAVLEAALGPDSYDVGDRLEKYAVFLRSQNRIAEAARIEARVRKIKEIASQPN